VPFGSARWTALPDDLSPDRGPKEEHPRRYVHRYHPLAHTGSARLASRRATVRQSATDPAVRLGARMRRLARPILGDEAISLVSSGSDSSSFSSCSRRRGSTSMVQGHNPVTRRVQRSMEVRTVAQAGSECLQRLEEREATNRGTSQTCLELCARLPEEFAGEGAGSKYCLP
jgi:hypothetical protein